MKLDLNTIAAFFMMGVGFFLLGISIPAILRIIKSGYGDLMDHGLLLFGIFGFTYIVAALLILLRLKIAFRFATLIMILSMITWIFLLYTEFYMDDELPLFIWSFSMTSIIAITCGILYVNNEAVIQSLNEEEGEQNPHEDILDQLL